MPGQAPAILVVDEAAAERIEVMALLSLANYQVTGAASFEEARNMLATKTPDLLITELRLGAFNGLRLVVLAAGDSVPAVILTSFPDPVLETAAKRERAAYLVRPVRSAALLTVVARVMGFA